MYAVVGQYQVPNGSVDDIVGRLQGELVPILRETPDFLAYYAVDGGNGALTTMSVFQNRAAAEAANREGSAWIEKNLAGLLGAPVVTAGTVAVYQGA